MNKVMSKHSKIITSSVMGIIIVILVVVMVILIRLNNHPEFEALGITDYKTHVICSSKPYTNRDYGFSLKCPDGWGIYRIIEKDSKLNLLISPTSSSSDAFDITVYMPNEKYTTDRFIADTKVADLNLKLYSDDYISAILDGMPMTKHIYYGSYSQYGNFQTNVIGVEYGIQLPSGGFAVASHSGFSKDNPGKYATLWSSQLDQYINWFDFSQPRKSILDLIF